MKIIISIVIVAAVIGGVVLFIPKQNNNAVPEVSPTLAGDYSLAVLNPDVFLKNPEDKDFIKVDGSTKVKEGSEIKTSASGRAKLLYPNGTLISIAENTDIKIESLADNGQKSKIKLVSGGIWSKIKNILGKSDYYQVNTENIVASVRGTVFAINFNNGASQVFGLENKVQVEALDKQGNAIPDTAIQLSSGNKVSLKTSQLPKQGQKLNVLPMTDTDYLNPIIKQNLLDFLEDQDKQNSELKIILEKISPTASPTASPSSTDSGSPAPSPSTTPTPAPIKSIAPSPTPSPASSGSPALDSTGSPQASPSTTPTPTPNPGPTIISIFPKTVSAGQEFTINGSGFTAGRNIKQVSQVLINDEVAHFAIIDAQTIFVTVPTMSSGSYSVKLQTITGETITASSLITIQ